MRVRGSLVRTGWWTIFSTTRSTTWSAAAAAATAAPDSAVSPSLVAMARGWATLQLSR